MLPFYEASNIEMSWSDIAFDDGGLGEDVFLEVTQAGEMKIVTWGIDGMGVSKSSIAGGTITLTLMQTSPINKQLADIANLEMQKGSPIIVAPFIVKDKTSDCASFVALNATLTKRTDHSYSSRMGTQTWIWTCEYFIPTSDKDFTTADLINFI